MTPLVIGVGVAAKAPLPGLCKTRLTPNLTLETAARIYEALLMDTLALVESFPEVRRFLFAAPEQDGVSVLAQAFPHWPVVKQHGLHLGERLANAIHHMLVNGCDVAIMLGSDSPLVPLHQALNACRWLVEGGRRQRAVLGPSSDGGYYLIALSADAPTLFSNIPWSTARVLEVSRQRAQAANLELCELDVATDVDDIPSLQRFAECLRVAPGAERSRQVLRELQIIE
jgi:rSAM/selenodomain-associated transferase 1